jgi:hypothetical protein
MDEMVLSWLLGTITVDLQETTRTRDRTAQQLWVALEGSSSTTVRRVPSTSTHSSFNMWMGPSRPSVPSRLPHAFFAAPPVGPPFMPPLAPLPLPRALSPQQQSWTPWSGEWDQQSLAGSFSTMELTPTPTTDWVAEFGTSNYTTPYSGSISSPRPFRLSIPTPSLLVMVPFYSSPQ